MYTKTCSFSFGFDLFLWENSRASKSGLTAFVKKASKTTIGPVAELLTRRAHIL